jgi:hypothetical protein
MLMMSLARSAGLRKILAAIQGTKIAMNGAMKSQIPSLVARLLSWINQMVEMFTLIPKSLNIRIYVGIIAIAIAHAMA